MSYSSTQVLTGAMSNLLAHEIAHALGVRHDGERNECDSAPAANKIMTPIVAAHAETWSQCSKVMARKFVDEGNAGCLT